MNDYIPLTNDELDRWLEMAESTRMPTGNHALCDTLVRLIKELRSYRGDCRYLTAHRDLKTWRRPVKSVPSSKRMPDFRRLA